MKTLVPVIFLFVHTVYVTTYVIFELISPGNQIAETEHSHKIIYSDDGLLNFTELARKYIGSGEEYDVITEDGYILKLFHIPGNVSNIVLFCPGAFTTPSNYLIRGNTSLMYMLAKRGFDVWAMCYRGLKHSRRHVRLNPDTDAKFWQFSMHEIGIFDYKAIIDFILSRTGQKQLSVVAYSEGTSAFFILTSERPEYNNKVKVFAALAPVCYFQYTGPTLRAMLELGPVVDPILKALRIEELFGFHSFEEKIIEIVCSKGIIGYERCLHILGFVTGFNPRHIEPAFTRTILGHFPDGTSRKNLIHFVHVYQQNDFVKYDYGSKNLLVYGTLRPPAYDLKKVTTKVAMFAAKSDIMSSLKDLERLRMTLPNVVNFHLVKDFTFNHIDYMWGSNAHKVLYPYVVDILLKYC